MLTPNKIIINFLAAAILVLAPITESFAAKVAKNYTVAEEELLIKEYDKLYDQWISDGLSVEEIYEKSLMWCHEKAFSSRSSVPDHKIKKVEQAENHRKLYK